MPSDEHPTGSSLADDELLWLRALARRLTLTDHDADDLVQDTWLQVSRHLGAPPEPGSRRAWLGGILRNRARMQRRGDDRRRRREANSGAPDPTEADDLAVHRHRVLSSLRDALDQLDESDRSLLLARYCDGHAAPDLAARLGIPASTIRTRLSRATARVRERLDERWGDRRAWAPAVAAPFAPPTSSISLWERIVMLSALQKLVAIIIGFVVGACVWVGTGPDDAEEAPIELAENTPLHDAPTPEAARPSPSATEAPSLTWSGVVLDVRTKRPLADAIVLVSPRLGAKGRAAWARTDASGAFTVTDLHPGPHAATAAKPGFVPARVPRLELPAEAAELALEAGGNMLEGTISDLAGGPVEDTLVRVHLGGRVRGELDPTSLAALTDADGHYQLSVPDGTWRVSAGGEDYTEASSVVTLRRGSGRLDLSLVMGASIHGRVVDRATGAVVPGARVSFHRRTLSGSSSSADEDEGTQADAEGRFTLRPLSAGTFSVFASSPGAFSIEEAVVSLAIAESVTGIVLRTDPAHDVSGRVVDESDATRGLPNVELQADTMEPPRAWYATTDAEGRFTFHGMPADTYKMHFDGEGVVARSMQDSLSVPSAEAVQFTLARGVRVTGRVDPPRPGVVFGDMPNGVKHFGDLFESTKLSHAHAHIGPDGRFEIEAMPVGKWKLVVAGDEGEHGEAMVEVPASGLDDVVLPAQPRSRVSGVVRGPDGRPHVGARVWLRNVTGTRPGFLGEGTEEEGPTFTATTGHDGSYLAVGLAEGHFKAWVERRGQRATSLRDTPTVDVDGTGAFELDLVVRMPAGRISGRVEAADGGPVDNVWISAVPEGRPKGWPLADASANDRVAVSEADGTFVLEELGDGAFTLSASGPDDTGRATQRNVAVDSVVALRLAPLGSVRGRVLHAGKPVGRFDVRAGLGGHPQTFMREDGTFTLERIEAGQVALAAVSEHGAAYQEVTVRREDVTDVELTLSPWGEVSGTVVSARGGTPVADAAILLAHHGAMRSGLQPALFDAILGGGETTDREGHFALADLGPGPMMLTFSTAPITLGGVVLGQRAVTLTTGGAVDLGEIPVWPAVSIPEGERGTAGLQLSLLAPGEAARPVPAPDAQLWVHSVEGPAVTAGVQAGDRVTACGGLTEAEVGAATLVLCVHPTRLRAGTVLPLTVEREDGTHDLAVRVRAP